MGTSGVNETRVVQKTVDINWGLVKRKYTGWGRIDENMYTCT